MGFNYKVVDQNGIYFITTTVVGWIDMHLREENWRRWLLKA